ncbi:MAG: glycosyltransferase family 39 protein, partial [Alphaproteobacteria bacterium]|nr:glycosyltransferase family 39 protein [Alphaproteobacteria bacterium]
LAHLFFFLAAERAIGNSYLAALATASWMLTYMLGYDVTQGNYTQSAALMAICAALLHVALAMRETAGWRSYLAAGALIGLGTLAKYGFPVFALTLFAAGLFDAKLRRAILNWRLLVGLMIALLLVAPHFLWLKFGPPLLRGAFTGALQVGWKGTYWQGVGAGLVSILRSSFDFLAPAVVLWAALFWRAFLGRVPAGDGEGLAMRRLFDRWLLLSYGVLVAGVLFAGATAIKYHYMVVVLLPAPIWLFLRVRDLNLPPWRAGAYAAAAMLAALAIVTVVAVRGFVGTKCGRCYLHWDYAGVSDKLRGAGFTGGTILADDHHVGGNLRTYFPHARLFTMKFEDYVPPRHADGNGGGTAGQCLVIWDATQEGQEIPEDLLGFARFRLSVRADEGEPPGLIEMPYRHARKRSLKLGYVLFPQGSGSCY